MQSRLFGSDPRCPAAARPESARPGIDRFGTGVSIVVLVAAATAAFVVRQNLDDHLYRFAANAAPTETTGAAVAK